MILKVIIKKKKMWIRGYRYVYGLRVNYLNEIDFFFFNVIWLQRKKKSNK